MSNDTPSRDFLAVKEDESHVLLNLLLREVRTLAGKVDLISTTIGVQAVTLALLDRDVKDGLARVQALEDQRDELIKQVVAKAVFIALGAAALISAVIAYYTRGKP